MAGSKRDRQRLTRQQQLLAAAEARRKEARKRTAWLVGGGAAALVVLVIVVVVLARGGGGKSVAVNGTSTTIGSTASTAPVATTIATVASAAGKPCVALSDPLPAGAPGVPVRVGPPPTQLMTMDLKVGSGAIVTANQTLTVNYIGVACSTGKIFDSSYSHSQPSTFPLSNVIRGWQNGIPGMRVGGLRLLGIPSADAYGPTGRSPTIAPDEALWFVVQVIDAKGA